MGIFKMYLHIDKYSSELHSLLDLFFTDMPQFASLNERVSKLANRENIVQTEGNNEIRIVYSEMFKLSVHLTAHRDIISDVEFKHIYQLCKHLHTQNCSVNLMSDNLNDTVTDIPLRKKGILDCRNIVGIDFSWLSVLKFSGIYPYQTKLRITVDELLAAPFYRAERLEGDRILIQISKDIHATEFCQEYYDRWVAIHIYFKELMEKKNDS